MKKNKFLTVVYVLTFFFALTGTTFAYFIREARSSEGAIASKSAVVGVDLSILPLYGTKPLIPMNDTDVMTAYENECIDIYQFGACKAYTITVDNIGEELAYEGTINFTLNDIVNLNYLVLDEDDEIYIDKTNIVAGTDQSLGASFTLPVSESRTFKLIIWLPNYEEYQDEYDGNGNFNATVTYKSANNYRIAGSISGS